MHLVDLTGLEPDDIETLVLDTLQNQGTTSLKTVQFIKTIQGITYDVTSWPLDEMMYEE